MFILFNFFITQICQIILNISNCVFRFLAPRIDASNSEFSMFFYKDLYTEEYLRKLGLNDRQIKAVMYVKEHGKIMNREYQELNNVSKPTATRDLTELVDKQLFIAKGDSKKETFYELVSHK